MEKVTVIIPTYNRPEILHGAVQHIQRNLIYDGPIEILIGDDGDDFSRVLYVAKYTASIVDVRAIEGPRKGLGANLNTLIQAADSELILQMDDDHYLVKPLDITQYVDDLLQFKNKVGWIRLFLGTEEDLNNDDPFYNFNAWMMERYWYPVPNRHELYIPSNRPHLKHRRFHDFYGMYSENVKLGETETHFCHVYADGHKIHGAHPDIPWVAIPVAAPSFDTWAHVGDSWQKQGL